MFFNRLFEIVVQIRQFFKNSVQIFAREGEQHTRGNCPNRDIGGFIRDQIGFTEVLSFIQQGNTQVAAVDTFTQYFHLSLSDDKELAAILTFDDQLITEGHRFRFEATCHTGNDRIG